MTAGYSKLRNQLFCRLFITAAVIIAIVFLDCNFFNEANAGIIGKIGEGVSWLKEKIYATFFRPNIHCPKQDTLIERYSMCFACMTMKVLLESFMTACSQSYYIVKEAGVKLLLIGTMLWVPFTVIKQVSSLTDPEAPSIVNELGKFTFKVIVAYMFITSGISVLVNLVINPVLATGADFANAFLDSGLPSPTEDQPTYVYNGPSDIISADVLNKIMTFTEGISRRVAVNMVLGNGLTCFATNAGFKISWLEIPDIWLWICGAVIWFVGLLLVLFVSYYLLDICFKIGFAILALPIVIGLWPFDITKNKVSVCFSIIISAAATYAFLSLITVFAMVMIDQGIGGVDKLFEAFEHDNIPYVQNKFSLTGGPFIIFCICFIYAVKMIGGNQQYTKKFFPDKIFKGYGPMHEYSAKIADAIKKNAVAPVKLAGDIAVHQTGRAAGGLVKGVMHAATGNKFKQGQYCGRFGQSSRQRDKRCGKRHERSRRGNGSRRRRCGSRRCRTEGCRRKHESGRSRDAGNSGRRKCGRRSGRCCRNGRICGGNCCFGGRKSSKSSRQSDQSGGKCRQTDRTDNQKGRRPC